VRKRRCAPLFSFGSNPEMSDDLVEYRDKIKLNQNSYCIKKDLAKMMPRDIACIVIQRRARLFMHHMLLRTHVFFPNFKNSGSNFYLPKLD
jgi:hypothetical protein